MAEVDGLAGDIDQRTGDGVEFRQTYGDVSTGTLFAVAEPNGFGVFLEEDIAVVDGEWHLVVGPAQDFEGVLASSESDVYKRQVVSGLATVLAASGAVWFDTRRRMRRRLERAERQSDIERERSRIAQDIHDDLGASLTRISMLSETARSELDRPEQAAAGLNQIYKVAHELTRAMDEIVWAVNPRHDSLEGLTSYLEKFAQDLLAAAGIRCRLDIPMEFPSWRPTADVRHNLFLAFKAVSYTHLDVYKRQELTDVCNFGGMNAISVQVDATENELWSYEGGGIYRGVRLVMVIFESSLNQSVFNPDWCGLRLLRLGISRQGKKKKRCESGEVSCRHVHGCN